MSQKTHYQDDLFILSVLVKSLEASLSVEADPEFYREHIAGDIIFVDATIRNFSGMLAQNSHLLDRTEYIKLLDRTARSFKAIIGKILDDEYPRADAYKSYAPQLAAVLREQEAIVQELGALLKSSADGESEVDLVSSDELSELLKG